jgi:hypothetical protein
VLQRVAAIGLNVEGHEAFRSFSCTHVGQSFCFYATGKLELNPRHEKTLGPIKMPKRRVDDPEALFDRHKPVRSQIFSSETFADIPVKSLAKFKFKDVVFGIQAFGTGEFQFFNFESETDKDVCLSLNVSWKTKTIHINSLLFQTKDRKNCPGFQEGYGAFLLEMVDAIAKANGIVSSTLEDVSKITQATHANWSLKLRLLATKGMTYYMSRGYLIDDLQGQGPENLLRFTNRYISAMNLMLDDKNQTQKFLNCVKSHDANNVFEHHEITEKNRKGLIRMLTENVNLTPRELMNFVYDEFAESKMARFFNTNDQKRSDILRDVFGLFFTQPCSWLFLPHDMVKFYKLEDGTPILTKVNKQKRRLSFEKEGMCVIS